MRNAIVSIKSKTIKLLAQELRYKLYIRREPHDTLENVIRWGSTQPLNISGRELNNSEAIKLTSNKKKCREFLRERGIPVPVESETEFPLICRSTYHTRGNGFWLTQNKTELQRAKNEGATYFSKIYDKADEYRVHVGGRRVLLVSVKKGDKSRLIWNRSNGFKLRHLHRHIWLEDELLLQMVKVTKKAIRLVNLNFGAVDVALNREEDQPFVLLEINTCPSLSPVAREKYVEYFREELQWYD